MDFDFEPYFRRYEQLAAAADAAFERVRAAHPDCVRCRRGCADCCHALFDMTLVEALYLNRRFRARFTAAARSRIEEEANRIDRRIAKIKRHARQELEAGRSELEVLEELGRERVRCPLLSEEDLCLLYEHRPLTCRFYGIPTASQGRGRTCGLSGFQTGVSYPTVLLDAVHAKLQELSAELLRDLQAKHVKLADLLVPLSSALLTDYDEIYFGLREEPLKEPPPRRKRSRRTP